MYNITVSPVFEQPVLFSIGRSIADDDHGMTESVTSAVAVVNIQHTVGIELEESGYSR